MCLDVGELSEVGIRASPIYVLGKDFEDEGVQNLGFGSRMESDNEKKRLVLWKTTGGVDRRDTQTEVPKGWMSGLTTETWVGYQGHLEGPLHLLTTQTLLILKMKIPMTQ